MHRDDTCFESMFNEQNFNNKIFLYLEYFYPSLLNITSSVAIIDNHWLLHIRFQFLTGYVAVLRASLFALLIDLVFHMSLELRSIQSSIRQN